MVTTTPITLIDKFTETMETKEKLLVTDFCVVEGRSGSLINVETADELNLITFTTNKISIKGQIVKENKRRIHWCRKIEGRRNKSTYR